MKNKVISLSLLLVLAFVCIVPAAAQNKAPDAVPGEVVYIPFPVKIDLDGAFGDWAGVPVQKVETGPKKSPNSKQNRVFEFAVASDEANIYVYMKSVDAKVIAGKHGKDTWNEDSMEFYVNFSGDFATKAYKAGIAQINISPINIGKKGGDALTVYGTNSDQVKVNAAVVKTDDGWAFEAAVPISGVKVAHGETIGFQAQANGATEGNRDSKLIWSKADKGDASYMDPHVFGKAVFFKVGSTDVPAAK